MLSHCMPLTGYELSGLAISCFGIHDESRRQVAMSPYRSIAHRMSRAALGPIPLSQDTLQHFLRDTLRK